LLMPAKPLGVLSEATLHHCEVTRARPEGALRLSRSHPQPTPKSSEMTAASVATTAKSVNDDPRLGQINLPSQSSRLTTQASKLTTWSATTADPLQTSPGSFATAHALVETNDDLRHPGGV